MSCQAKKKALAYEEVERESLGHVKDLTGLMTEGELLTTARHEGL